MYTTKYTLSKGYYSMSVRQQKYKSFWIRWGLTVIAVLLFTSSAVLWVLQFIITGQWSVIASVIFAGTGVILALIQWLFPISLNRSIKHETSNSSQSATTTAFSLPLNSQSFDVVLIDKSKDSKNFWR